MRMMLIIGSIFLSAEAYAQHSNLFDVVSTCVANKKDFGAIESCSAEPVSKLRTEALLARVAGYSSSSQFIHEVAGRFVKKGGPTLDWPQNRRLEVNNDEFFCGYRVDRWNITKNASWEFFDISPRGASLSVRAKGAEGRDTDLKLHYWYRAVKKNAAGRSPMTIRCDEGSDYYSWTMRHAKHDTIPRGAPPLETKCIGFVLVCQKDNGFEPCGICAGFSF